MALLSFLAACWGDDPAPDWSVLGDADFDAAAWAQANTATRGTMVADLIDKHALVGMERDAVVALLGPPTAYFDYDSNLGYFVGPDTVSSPYGPGYMMGLVVRDGRVDAIDVFPDLPSR